MHELLKSPLHGIWRNQNEHFIPLFLAFIFRKINFGEHYLLYMLVHMPFHASMPALKSLLSALGGDSPGC